MTVAKRYVPNKALKKKNGYCLGTRSPAANKRSRDTKTPVQKSFQSFFSEKQSAQEKARRRRGSQKNAVGKNAKRGTVPYL